MSIIIVEKGRVLSSSGLLDVGYREKPFQGQFRCYSINLQNKEKVQFLAMYRQHYYFIMRILFQIKSIFSYICWIFLERV